MYAGTHGRHRGKLRQRATHHKPGTHQWHRARAPVPDRQDAHRPRQGDQRAAPLQGARRHRMRHHGPL
eukprot:8310620-Prorocentrum_lima.AAC.1